ncbi:hypothetical protein ACFOEZ_04580 [Tianweitania populi]|uniref:Uncharacterized protein n=1 Tax=Tianweitania populi TaxID=1607949 RepID=A0A8J3GKM6_9HYPH|nr:hypothetical protein [Tianweitania populi]GHD08121.1 hypothetical protein GCM10016234_07310 [Tianweitania populi]
MIRLVFFALFVAALWIGIFQIVRMIRARQIDWRGVGLAVCFIGLAIFLHQQTGIGGLFDN